MREDDFDKIYRNVSQDQGSLIREDYYSYIKEGFKKWAHIYDIWIMPISRVRDKVVDFTNVRSSSKILDVATGTGKQAFAFAKKGYNVIGIDL